LFGFGSKTALDEIARVIVVQSNALALTAHLGPAALAMFSRPYALSRQLDTLISKVSFVMTPAVGALEGGGRREELRDLFLQGTRITTMLAVGAITFLAVVGDLLLRLWMGPAYANAGLLQVLALGHLLVFAQRPAVQLLVGMNLHGRVAISSIAAGIVAVLGAWNAPYGLMGAAVIVMTAPLLSHGIFVPVWACRQLQLPLRTYLTRVIGVPLACGVPYALLLEGARWAWEASDEGLAIASTLAAVCVFAALNWRFVLTAEQRAWVTRRAAGAGQALSRSGVQEAVETRGVLRQAD
jgi:O-antigen/teichoic acid export membrane protein